MDDHFNVNAIAPGPFKSKMTAPLYATDEMEPQSEGKLPNKTLGIDGRRVGSNYISLVTRWILPNRGYPSL
ncbi:MAG: hypothetical protein Ct9H300mP8_08020 [Gammaproteobacteria bacterium]|nr:MAG: hypothetical protein Ct9H300mP8_08020 [Gammaproteobacteria bacterium]